MSRPSIRTFPKEEKPMPQLPFGDRVEHHMDVCINDLNGYGRYRGYKAFKEMGEEKMLHFLDGWKWADEETARHHHPRCSNGNQIKSLALLDLQDLIFALQEEDVANKKRIEQLEASDKVQSELINQQTATLNHQEIINRNQAAENKDLKGKVALFERIICVENKYDCAGLIGETENGADKLSDLSGHEL